MIAVLAGELRGHGRTKAVLACCAELASDETVRLYAGTGSWAPSRLEDWHGLSIEAEWRLIDWNNSPDIETLTARADAAIAWAKPLATRLQSLDCHTVAWVESGGPPGGVDAVWCPSPTVAARCRSRLSGDTPTIHALAPIWYLEGLPEPTDRDRDIDVLLHGRKARDAEDRLPDGLTVVTTGGFTHAELVEHFERSRVFCHPHGPRFEPLGLMPLEAAKYGCKVAVPSNSGAADLIPGHAYEQPVEHVPELLESDAASPTIPNPIPPQTYLP